MGKINTSLTVFSIYNGFAYVQDTAEKICGSLKTNCWFYDYYECLDYGIFLFKMNSKYGDTSYKIRISISRNEYEYYDDLVELLKNHRGWSIHISEYNHCIDRFCITFKRPRMSGVEIHIYTISEVGVKLLNDEWSREIADYMCNDTLDDFSRKVANYLQDDAVSVYETFKDLPAFSQVPTLSKPPIFNPPATICYWDDGTKTVVKCQEGDPYSPEAGLALCYMKKVLGNTSKDLNKELHKYISEKEE